MNDLINKMMDEIQFEQFDQQVMFYICVLMLLVEKILTYNVLTSLKTK